MFLKTSIKLFEIIEGIIWTYDFLIAENIVIFIPSITGDFMG